MAAYLDESGTHADAPVMCVAGYLFTADDAKRFTDEWDAAVRSAGLSHFHMTDCANGGGEFTGWAKKRRDTLARDLITLIRARMTYGFAVSMSVPQYERMAPQGWIEREGSAYTACLHLALVLVGAWAQRAGYDGRVAYFFEAGHARQEEAHKKLNAHAARPLQRDAIRYGSHTFASKGNEAGRLFDAADYLAWQYYKHHDRVLMTPPHLPEPPERRDYAALREGQHDRYGLLMAGRDYLPRLFAAGSPDEGR